ncbi:MAG TPA: hypothetical protein VJ970_01750, partial [Flavobacteriaceae bacterium]|nr:hypothetical protein [Flavobacteriaceae bacterium]
TDIDIIKEMKDDLESIGFLFDEITSEKIIVKGVPTTVLESETTVVLENLIDDVKNEVPEASFSQIDILAKSLAKSLAIKTGTKLAVKEREAIVNKLFLCKQPDRSPYGKKTFVTITLNEIDKNFNI